MANFQTAQKIVANNEGGYSFDKDDTGGETAFGLTRRDWPNWHGWAIVDAYKRNFDHNIAIQKINADTSLKQLASDLFKTNYWDVIKGDWINDQQIGNQCYDTAINMGTGRAAEFMQKAAGVTVDRIIGHGTIDAINKMEAKTFYNAFLALRKAKYDSIISANPIQAKFKASWYSRLTPYKQP